MQRFDLADAGAALGRLLVGDERIARRADGCGRPGVRPENCGPGNRETA
jgi:hypothetical protein